MTKIKTYTVVKFTDELGNTQQMKLNRREMDLYNLLLSKFGRIVSFEEIEQTIGINPNLARVTKFALQSKLPMSLEISTVYAKGYFLSKSSGLEGEN